MVWLNSSGILDNFGSLICSIKKSTALSLLSEGPIGGIAKGLPPLGLARRQRQSWAEVHEKL
jgi:hypothetical protein